MLRPEPRQDIECYLDCIKMSHKVRLSHDIQTKYMLSQHDQTDQTSPTQHPSTPKRSPKVHPAPTPSCSAQARSQGGLGCLPDGCSGGCISGIPTVGHRLLGCPQAANGSTCAHGSHPWVTRRAPDAPGPLYIALRAPAHLLGASGRSPLISQRHLQHQAR